MAWFSKIFAAFQQHSQAIAGVGLATAISLSMVPQTLGLPRYRRMLAHYKDSVEVPIDHSVQELIDKVLARINLQPHEEVKLTFFTSFPSDPVHKGSVQMKTGALIGLPSTLAYRSVDEIQHESIQVEGHFIDWTSETAQSLLNSLVLSDKAKAFVIAREIKYVTGYNLHVDTVTRTLFGVLAYWTGYSLNKKFYLTERLKIWARVSAFSLVAAGWLVMYVAVTDAWSCWRDNSVDWHVAQLKRVYAEGGMEYYDNVLQRNRALRKLLRSNGERQFTKFGNEVTLLRNSHVQLTSRRDNLRKYLKEYDIQSEEQKPDKTQ